MYLLIVYIMIKPYLLVKCVNAIDNARTAVRVQNYIIATLTNFVLSVISSTNNTSYYY